MRVVEENMKKRTKLILLFICLALIATALIVGTQAASGTQVPTAETNGRIEYTDMSGVKQTTDSIKTAISGAMNGSTVKLLGDHYFTYAEAIAVNNKLTIDLNGHILAFSQGGQACFAPKSVIKFMNGTVIAVGNKSYHSNSNFGYAFVRPSATGTTVTFENVNSYTSCLVVDGWQGGITVDIKGGEHHVVYTPGNLMGGGLVETRKSATVKISDATVYYSTTNPLNAQMYNASATSSATYTAERTSFISSDGAKSVIGYASACVTFNFDACNIFGTINPVLSDNDLKKGCTEIPASQIVLKGGSRMGSTTVQDESKISAGSGSSRLFIDERESFSLSMITGNLYFDPETQTVFDTNASIGAPEDVACYYNTVFGSKDDYLYSYEIGDGRFYTESLSDALEYTHGKVYVNSSSNITLTGDELVSVSKSGVLDLQGNRLDVMLSEGGAIEILDNVDFTICNGQIGVCTDSESTDEALFAVYGEGVKLTVDNVDISADNLIDSISSDLTVRIKDSSLVATDEYFLEDTAPFIVSRGAMDFKAEGSTLIADMFPTLFSISSDGAVGKTTLEFVDSGVIAADSDMPIILYANENTSIKFNNTDVFGTVEPTVYPGDTVSFKPAGAMTQTSVFYGVGTRLSGAPVGGVVSSGYVHESVSERENVSYLDNYGSTLTTYANFNYKVAAPSADAVATYVKDGITHPAADIKTALSSCDGGYTVYMLKSVTLVESEKAFVTVSKDITLDLGGKTLEVIQQGESNISVKANFTVKNGALRTKMTTTETSVANKSAGASYPLLCYAASGITINLENVNTYGGSVVFAYNGTDLSLNVVGGRHQAVNKGTGNDNAWVNIRCDVDVNVTGATFILGENSSLVADTLWKDTNATDLHSSYVFTDCKIISDGAKANVINYATEHSSFTFNNCFINGRISPALHKNDASAGYSAIKPGSIVLGLGTRIAGTSNIEGGVIVTEAGTALKNSSYTETYQFIDFKFNANETAIIIFYNYCTANLTEIVVGESEAPITVIFYAADGKTVIKTQTVNSGDTVTPPDYTPAASNGWVSTTWSGWSESFMGEPVTSFTVTGDKCYYPAPTGEITPSLTAALYNISLTGKVSNHLYIPESANGVSELNVYDKNGRLLSYTRVRLSDGNVYRLYNVGEVDATGVTTDTVVSASYKFLGTDYTETISLSPYKYAAAVLKDSREENPVYPASAHVLVADLVRYSNALTLATKGAENESLKALIDTYGDLCSEMPAFQGFSTYTANTTELRGVIASIQLEVSSTEPRWRFNIASGVDVASISVSVDGYYAVIKDGVNFGRVEYQTIPNANATAFYTANIPMYNLDRLMTVTVTLADGTVRVGSYNLDTYFRSFSVRDEDLNAIQNFLRAFRAFGISSAGYKYAGGIVRDGGFIDKFDCEHKSVGSFTPGRGRHCADCNAQVFFYTDYGAKADGVSDRKGTASGTNDFEAIYKCHNEANTRNTFGYDTIVVAVAHGQTNVNYYIGTPHVVESIAVQTDTDWAGANFIVDDRTVSQSLKNGYYTPVFKVVGAADSRSIVYSGTYKNNGEGILKGATNIGFEPGRPMMIHLQDLKHRNNDREGLNANGGQTIQEVILVDEYGNVSPTTPIQWNYVVEDYCKYGCETVDADANKVCDTCSTNLSNPIRIYGYAVDDEPIRISGLDSDGNIAFTWENVTDDQVDVSKYDQCQRTIRVERSNVTVEGIDRYFTEDSDKNTPRQTYAGIVNTQYSNNVLIKDMLVQHHIGHYIQENGKNTTNSLGSYEFSGGYSINVTWKNCRAKNFFNSDGSVTYRGMFGTNYMRNSYLKDCILQSWDSHSGAYNVTIEDSTFEHINFIGAGDITIKNTVIYTDGTDAVIHLRQDYGSNWEGNVYIDGLELRYADTSITNIDLIKAYYTNWYFGTDTYLPTDVYVNDVVINRFSRSNANMTVGADGKIVENIVATNAIPLGLYTFLNSKLTKDYDYSTSNANNLDPKHCTENIYITNIGNLKLKYPDHPFFEDMNIFLDGAMQSWYTRRSSLKHTDNNGDMKCDTCYDSISCSATHPTSGTDSGATCGTCGANIKKEESSDDNCVTGDTLVTLADGSVKRADELTLDDLLLVYDHFTGEYIAAPILFIENDGVKEYNVITLTFRDGRQTKLIGEHAYFDLTLGKYVYVNEKTLYDYIGHEFAFVTDGGFEAVALAEAVSELTVSGCYSFVTAYHYNTVVDGLLSIPGGIDGLFNIFEYDESLKFDEEKMAADIEAYGTFTYADFEKYVPYEVYEAFGAAYFKVAIGKGNLTFDTILYYIEKYVVKNGLM